MLDSARTHPQQAPSSREIKSQLSTPSWSLSQACCPHALLPLSNSTTSRETGGPEHKGWSAPPDTRVCTSPAFATTPGPRSDLSQSQRHFRGVGGWAVGGQKGQHPHPSLGAGRGESSLCQPSSRATPGDSAHWLVSEILRTRPQRPDLQNRSSPGRRWGKEGSPDGAGALCTWAYLWSPPPPCLHPSIYPELERQPHPAPPSAPAG